MKKESIMETIVKTILGFSPILVDGKKLFVYDDAEKIWKLFEKRYANRMICEKLPESLKFNLGTSIFTKALDAVKNFPEDYVKSINLSKIEERYRYIAFANKIVKIEKEGIKEVSEEKSKEKVLTRRLKANYVKPVYGYEGILEDAPCFMEFCRKSFGAEYVQALKSLLEIMGYIMCDFTKAQKAFFMIGKPRCGKSLIMKFIEEIIGREYVTDFDIDKLGERFNVAQLYGKVVNLCYEVPTDKIRNIAVFKKIVAGDSLSGEYKMNPNFFEFTATVKLLSAGNHMPEFAVSDGSQSIFERLHILYFPLTVSEEDRDKDLLDKLLMEKDVIVSAAVERVVELLNNDYQFTLTNDSQKIIQEYALEGMIIEDFLQDCCEYGEGFKVYKSDVYNTFEKYVIENGLEIKISHKVLASKILQNSSVKSMKARVAGKPLAAFCGMRLKEGWKNE